MARQVKANGYPMVLCFVLHRKNEDQIRDILDLAVALEALDEARATRDPALKAFNEYSDATKALMAAKAGATYASPFVGRLDDVGQDGMDVIMELYDEDPISVQLPDTIEAALARKAGCKVSTTTCGLRMDPELALRIVESGIDIVARPRFSNLAYAGPKKATRLPRR